MAVQKSRVTRSKRGMRRAHDGLDNPTLSVDATTGETHRRHNITKDGYYRGKQIIVPKAIFKQDKEAADAAADKAKE
jgi:large subunit ribosomal protein L32